MDELGPDSSIARIVKARWYKTERGGLITIPPPAYEVDELGELVMTGDEAVTHAVGTVSRNSPSSVACTSSSRVGSAKGSNTRWSGWGRRLTPARGPPASFAEGNQTPLFGPTEPD
jgi:hypothetical protein